MNGSMFNLNEQQLTDLAMNNDPSSILQALSSIPQGNFLTQPQPPGVTPGAGPSYESIVGGMPMQAPGAPPPPAAPLSDTALRTLAGMNPRDVARAPAAGIPGRSPQVQLQPVAGGARPRTLAEILGMR